MKAHPLTFHAEMVRAIVEGRQNQTRRPIKPSNSVVGEGRVDWKDFDWEGKSIHRESLCKAPLPWVDGSRTNQYVHVPYRWASQGTIYPIYPRYDVGDRLWVKETWWAPPSACNPSVVQYAANLEPHQAARQTWMPAISMPRWASRLLLTITAIQAQRLQDISDLEIPVGHHRAKKHPWESNPWVWAYTFEKLEARTK